jgi:hypothetical protein
MAAAVCVFAAVETQAQPLFPAARSIEATVANADLVVVGTLIKFVAKEQTVQRGGHEIGLEVSETLKQDLFTDPYERLGLRVANPPDEINDWLSRGNKLLVAHDDNAPDECTVFELAPGRCEVLTADFTLLRDGKDVLAAAKETVRRMPVAIERIHTYPLVVPRAVIAGTKWEPYYGTGGHLRLSVPVDQKLEKRAQDYIDSDSYQNRQEGVRALRYFSSNQNIARVKRLLVDPGWGHLKHAGENQGVEVRWYGVRDEAYRTLRAWGVDVEKPVIREEVRKN